MARERTERIIQIEIARNGSIVNVDAEKRKKSFSSKLVGSDEKKDRKAYPKCMVWKYR